MTQALREARQELSDYDVNRDAYELRNRIHHLTKIGMSADDIGEQVGLSGRIVVRHRSKPPAPQPPRLYNAAVSSEKRVRELDQRANLTLQLAAILRDEDPCLVWGSLCRLSRRELQEVAVIALAAIPTGRTKHELLSWVMELPAAQEEL